MKSKEPESLLEKLKKKKEEKEKNLGILQQLAYEIKGRDEEISNLKSSLKKEGMDLSALSD